MPRETVRIRTGQPGSGKTYSVVRELLDWLGETDGTVFHNLPLNVDAFADHFVGSGTSPGRIRERLVRIPEEVEQSWRLCKSGPADYFDQFESIAGAWILIDEGHTVCARSHEASHRRKWSAFTAELRHRGACLEFLTQHSSQIADEVEVHISCWIECRNRENERDPFCHIPMSDWWQFGAKLSGSYSAVVMAQEYTNQMRKWVPNDKLRQWPLDPRFYVYYDSYAGPKHGGASGRLPHPWESRSWPGLVWWFVRKHWGRLLWSPAAGFVAMLLILFWLGAGRAGAGTPPASAPAAVVTTGVVNRLESAPGVNALDPDRRPSGGTGPAYVVGIADSGVLLSDGTVVFLSESIDAKRTLQSVDPVRGVALLSDGERLQLRPSVVPASAGAVAGDLPPGGAIGDGAEGAVRATDR